MFRFRVYPRLQLRVWLLEDPDSPYIIHLDDLFWNDRFEKGDLDIIKVRISV